MSFGGSLADHILPEKTHVISVSFLVESMRKQRGGVGGNVCYNLALLGVQPTLLGAVGSDFGPYRIEMERMGVDLANVLEFDDHHQAHGSAVILLIEKGKVVVKGLFKT